MTIIVFYIEFLVLKPGGGEGFIQQLDNPWVAIHFLRRERHFLPAATMLVFFMEITKETILARAAVS